MISIVDNSELTKLMSIVVVNNSGSAKLLPMLVCRFHMVGAGTFRGLAHKHGRRPGTRTCYITGKWFHRIDKASNAILVPDENMLHGERGWKGHYKKWYDGNFKSF
jgi:hypothetical protein